MTYLKTTFVLAVMVLAGLAGHALAQPGPGGGGRGGPGGPGGPPNFDPAAFRQMMMDRIREQLGATDDEWRVLQPRVEAVMKAQQDARSGGGGMFMGPPRGGFDNQQPQTPLQRASQELRAALDDTNTPMPQIEQKLAAFRAARDAARQQLVNAQKALQDLLTPRQEAVLVVMGTLE